MGCVGSSQVEVHRLSAAPGASARRWAVCLLVDEVYDKSLRNLRYMTVTGIIVDSDVTWTEARVVMKWNEKERERRIDRRDPESAVHIETNFK